MSNICVMQLRGQGCRIIAGRNPKAYSWDSKKGYKASRLNLFFFYVTKKCTVIELAYFFEHNMLFRQLRMLTVKEKA